MSASYLPCMFFVLVSIVTSMILRSHSFLALWWWFARGTGAKPSYDLSKINEITRVFAIKQKIILDSFFICDLDNNCDHYKL